jgi:hypothetical protein
VNARWRVCVQGRACMLFLAFGVGGRDGSTETSPCLSLSLPRHTHAPSTKQHAAAGADPAPSTRRGRRRRMCPPPNGMAAGRGALRVVARRQIKMGEQRRGSFAPLSSLVTARGRGHSKHSIRFAYLRTRRTQLRGPSPALLLRGPHHISVPRPSSPGLPPRPHRHHADRKRHGHAAGGAGRRRAPRRRPRPRLRVAVHTAHRAAGAGEGRVLHAAAWRCHAGKKLMGVCMWRGAGRGATGRASSSARADARSLFVFFALSFQGTAGPGTPASMAHMRRRCEWRHIRAAPEVRVRDCACARQTRAPTI